MADPRSVPFSRKLVAAVPYVLPVLGGLVGVIYVNLVPMSFVNPVFGVGIGAVAGWAIARFIVRLMTRRMLQGQGKQTKD